VLFRFREYYHRSWNATDECVEMVQIGALHCSVTVEAVPQTEAGNDLWQGCYVIVIAQP
jgi:hypothetical protein